MLQQALIQNSNRLLTNQGNEENSPSLQKKKIKIQTQGLLEFKCETQ